MRMSKSYRISLIAACCLHLMIIILFGMESTNQRPVLVNDAKNEASTAPMALEEQKAQAIKAVSVDSQEVLKEVNKLKEQREQQKQAELNRQRALQKQAEAARQQRIAEQKRLEALKQEAAKVALEKQKKLAEEQANLKKIAAMKAEQEKHLAELQQQQAVMKQQQALEAKKLADMQQQHAQELARAEQIKQAAAKAELAKKQQEAAQQQAALDSANNARVAGEVDKYKALIINAISRQWILPENANSSMSSQFRIRLAPNGSVLAVNLMRSSGDALLDRSAQAAIFKASPLPVPSDPTVFNLFRDISLTVRPVNARG